jgi:predicted DNA-binding transcriptional regulator AlpA
VTATKPESSTGNRNLRPQQQWQKLGIGRSTLYKIAKADPSFPLAFSLADDGRAKVRRERDLDAWNDNRADKRNAGDAQ